MIDRDEIIEILRSELDNLHDSPEIVGIRYSRIADRLEQQPISEEEIAELADEYSKGHYTDSESIKQAYDDYYTGFKDAQFKPISEEMMAEVFANHSDRTPYLNFESFKAALKELDR